MSDTVSFGEGVMMSAQPATMRTIFAHTRKYASDDSELVRFVAEEEEFDAIGGYFFDHLSLSALLRLKQVVERIETDLPDAISNWATASRPLFYENFAEFKIKLSVRISQLCAHARQR